MPTWNPAQYLRFGDERLRPALDLLARIDIQAPRIVYDLGCGPGSVTVLLKERWPGARITGVDSSPAMLEKARSLDPAISWEESDVSVFEPDLPADLLFSNAVLHWLDEHELLFPRLLEALTPGGVLAVQMPSNFTAPTHTAITETIEGGSWRELLSPLFRSQPVLDMAGYHRILSPLTTHLDLWETTYVHRLEGEDPVVEWTKGTALRPILDRLDENDSERFLNAYRVRIRSAYPPEPDGRTVYPFRRLFLIATK